MVTGIYAMRVSMAFFSMRMLVMSVGVSRVPMSVVVEEEETDDVGSKAKGPNNEDELWMRDILRLNKSLDGFKKNGQAKRHKKDTIDKGTKRFSALPLLVVSTHAELTSQGCLPRMCTFLSYSSGWRP